MLLRWLALLYYLYYFRLAALSHSYLNPLYFMDWHSFDIQLFRLGRGRVNQAASVLSKRLEIMCTAAGR